MAVSMSFLIKPATTLSSLLLTLSLVGLGNAGLAQNEDASLEGAEMNDTSVVEPTRSLGSTSSTLSIEGGRVLMAEAETAIADQNYDVAAEKLQEARQKFNQLSNFYQELAQMFLGIDTQLHQSNRSKALETAQLRDQASYQLALVYRAQNQPDRAVPLLMEILRSQQPTRELGQQAYQQLFELGFVDEPYNGSGSSTTSSNE
jgi:polyribonucleotide nucleotidyltransferase